MLRAPAAMPSTRAARMKRGMLMTSMVAPTGSPKRWWTTTAKPLTPPAARRWGTKNQLRPRATRATPAVKPAEAASVARRAGQRRRPPRLSTAPEAFVIPSPSAPAPCAVPAYTHRKCLHGQELFSSIGQGRERGNAGSGHAGCAGRGAAGVERSRPGAGRGLLGLCPAARAGLMPCGRRAQLHLRLGGSGGRGGARDLGFAPGLPGARAPLGGGAGSGGDAAARRPDGRAALGRFPDPLMLTAPLTRPPDGRPAAAARHHRRSRPQAPP